MNAKNALRIAKKEVINSVRMLENGNVTVWYVTLEITKGLIMVVK